MSCHTLLACPSGRTELSSPIIINCRKDPISLQIDLRAKGAVITSHQLENVGVPFDARVMCV